MEKLKKFQMVFMLCSFLLLLSGNAVAVNVSGTISTPTVWTLANSPYLVTGDVTVNAGITLTIEAGVIVKFKYSYTGLTVNGTLKANGTASSRIYFTSYKDDTGGDTNGDMGATLPATGDWDGLYFVSTSTDSLLNYTVIRYGSILNIRTSSLTLSNSLIESIKNYGMSISEASPIITECTIQNSGKSGIYAYYSASPTVTGCTIQNNNGSGIYASSSKGVFNGNTIKNNKGYGLEFPGSVNATILYNIISGNSYGDAIQISGTLDGDRTWYSGVTWLLSSTVTVPAGKILTVEPGAVVKFSSGDSLTVNGTLNAVGTAVSKIYFTSVKDDTVGGDSNGDLEATLPASGDWSRLYFTSTSIDNNLNYIVIRYGGSGYGSMEIRTSSLTISNSLIDSSEKDGIYIYGASPTVTGCTIQNCTESGIYASSSKGVFTGNTIKNNKGYGLELPVSVNTTLQNNNFSGNKYNAILISGTLDGDRTWQSGITWLLSSTVTVPAGKILTVEPGAVVKFSSGDSLTVNGTLNAVGTAVSKIYFTSVKDDTVGGDSNGDLGATFPALGDWNRLNFGSTSTENFLNYTVIRYAVSVGISTSSLTLSNSLIESNKNDGVYISGASPAITGCTIQNNTGSGIYASSSKGVFTGNTIKNNTGYGLELPGSVNATILNNIISGNSYANAILISGTLDGDRIWYSGMIWLLSSTVTVPAGKILTVEPGAVVKFSSGDSLTVNGTLNAVGTVASKIYFTSVKDDTVGGDSNGDLGATLPAAGDWNRLSFSSTSTDNMLNYNVIRYGGSSVRGTVEVSTSALTVSNSVIENSKDYGVYIYKVSPTLTGCTIQNSGKSGIYASSSKGVFSGNTIKDNAGYGLEMPYSVNATVQNSTLSGNKYNAILISGTLDSDEIWQGGITWLLSSTVTVPIWKKLTVEPGAVVKFSSGASLTVNGTLTAEGSADSRIYFTSYRDDTVGGDTNGDEEATTPAPGDWGRLYFTSTSTDNVLNYTEVRYGGSSSAQIYIQTSSLTLSNSLIDSSSNHGIYISGESPTITGCMIQNSMKSGIYASSSKAVFTGNTIQNNTGYGLELPGSVNVTVQNNIFFENNYDNAILISGTLDGDRTWHSGMTWLVSGTLTVPVWKKLTVEPGAVVKFSSGKSITVNGTLIADGSDDNRIYFTSYTDDTLGGDSNGDEQATSPSPGDWGRLYFSSTSENSLLNYAEVRYGGALGSQIEIETSSLKIRNSIIEKSNGYGIQMLNASPSFAGNRIRSCYNYGVYLTSSNPMFRFNAVMNNTPGGLHNDSPEIVVNVENNYWGDETGPLDSSDDRDTGGLYNPGGKGNVISNYADYNPYLTSDPYSDYQTYLQNAILLMQMLVGIDVGDISYIEDINNDKVLGLPETINIMRKAAKIP